MEGHCYFRAFGVCAHDETVVAPLSAKTISELVCQPGAVPAWCPAAAADAAGQAPVKEAMVTVFRLPDGTLAIRRRVVNVETPGIVVAVDPAVTMTVERLDVTEEAPHA